jgi:hypothetical protein
MSRPVPAAAPIAAEGRSNPVFGVVSAAAGALERGAWATICVLPGSPGALTGSIGMAVAAGAPMVPAIAAPLRVVAIVRLIVGTETGHVMVLDARSGARRGSPTKVAGSGIAQIAASPDGQLLAVSPLNGGVALWDLRARSRVGDEFPITADLIPQVAFEPDGRLLITEASRAIEWPVDRPTLQRAACQIAGRDVTRDQWTDILPNRPYRPVCPAPGARAQDDTDG